MYKLSGHSLTRGKWFLPESQGVTIQERDGSCSLTLGPEAPEIGFDDWMLDEYDGSVWRVKSMDDTPSNDTRSIEAEPVIKTLDGISITGGDVNPAVITGDSSAISCSARTALRYLLGLQSDWQLGDVAFEHSDYYEFSEGDTIYDAIESVTSTLEDSVWVTDTSSYPFTLHIRKMGNAAQCEMRGGRNLSTLRKSINRSGMYTRIFPVGQNDLRLPEGYLAKNEIKYGRIDHHETDQSRTTEDSLRSWAQARLNRHCEPEVSISITGLELSESTGEPLDRLTINTICRVPLHDWGRETILERIVKKQWPDRRKEPQKVNITLANTKADITSLFRQSSRSAGRAARGQAKQNYLFVANGENLMYEIFDESGHLHGLLRMTEESFRLAFDNLESSLRSELLLTAESLRLAFENDMDSLRGEIDMTAESLRISFENDVSSLRSEINLSAESLRIAFDNGMSSLRSEINVTAESLRVAFESDVSSLRSEINLSAESLRVAFESDVSSLRSEINLSAESLRVAFASDVSSLRSEIATSAESLRISFESDVSSLRSDISVSAESLRIAFNKGLSSVRSEFNVSAESLRVAFESDVSSLRSEIQTQADRIGLVVTGSGPNASVSRAALILAINNGRSSATLKADTIDIDGLVESLEAKDVMVQHFNAAGGEFTEDLSVLQDLSVAGDTSLNTLNTVSLTIDGNDVLIYDAEVNGNTLTIWKTDGTSINFSKATALSGQWLSRVFTVVATQEGSPLPIGTISTGLYDGLVLIGEVSHTTLLTHHFVSADLGVYEDDSGSQGTLLLQKTMTLPADEVYQDGYNAGVAEGGSAAADAERALIRTRFAANNGQYYIESYENISGGPAISGTQIYYTLNVSAAAGSQLITVELLNSNGTRMTNTPNMMLTLAVDQTSASLMSGGTAIASVTHTQYADGQNAVTITKGAWSAGRIEFTKSAGTPSTKSVQLTAAAPVWDENTATVAIWDGNGADVTQGVNTGYTVTVNAGARYTAGQNSVAIQKGTWSGGRIEFTKSAGTANTKSVQLTAAAAVWDGNTASVVIWDGTAADSSHGVQTGYTVNVDASARYTAGETAGQNAVTINKGTWSGGRIEFTKSAGTPSTKSVQLTAAAATWDGNTATVAIWDGTGADASSGVNTGYTVTVNAGARYTAGQNDVTITKGSWSGGKISFTKSAGTASTKSVQLTAAAATWNGNTASVVIWDGTAADSSHGVQTGYTVTVDASARYTAGETAGQNAVTITKGAWSGGKISFTKSAGTASTKSVQLTAAAATWNGNTASVVIWDGTAADSSHGVQTGYTVTVDASARYTAGETAGQNAVTITKGAWNGGKISFTKSAGTASTKSVQLTAAAATWDGNTASVVIWDGTAADSSHGVQTGYTVTVDASARYTAGEEAGMAAGTTAGQNAVTIIKGSWNAGKISFTKSAGTASTKSVQLTAAAATWNGNTASVVIWDGTAADSSHGTSTGYTVTVDASARYTAGETAGTTAGQNAVAINKGTWSGGKISFTKSVGTASTKSVQLTAAAPTWNGNTASVVIWDGTAANSSSGVQTGYTVTVDASARYTAGEEAGMAAGTTAGQNAVTINKGTWSGGQISFTKSVGTASTKSVQLTAAAATWSGNTASVVIWDGTAADSSHGVQTGYTVTVDASGRYAAGEEAGITAGQNAVTINKGAWNAGKISFTKSAGTASTKSVQLTAAAATWSGNTASVVIWDGTAANTSSGVQTGYTVTVDASARYTAGEEAGLAAGTTAGQNAVTINKGSWNAGKISFTKSAGTASTKSVQLTAAAATWSGNTASVVIWDGTAANTSSGVQTGYTVTVDASARYTAGETAGQNAVTITKGTWSGGKISFTKSAGTASTKSVQLTAAAATWSGNTASVVIWDGTAANTSSGVQTGYTVTVDASARYTAGETAGQNAVTITKGAWSGGKISFTKSAGTASTKSVQLTAAAASWDGNTATVAIWDGTAANTSSGVQTGYTVTVDASARYTAGEEAGMAAGTTAGQNAVTITKGSWNAGKISFTKSVGTDSTKSVQLTAAAATWSGNTASVVIWDGTAADSSHGVQTGYTVTVDASARYTAGETAGMTAGQNAVTINKGTWSGGKISFTKSVGTASTKSVQLTAAAATWSGNTASVVIWDGTAADSSHGVQTGYTVTVDASARYTAGETAGITAGQNAVTITKGSWNAGQISFTKSVGTDSTKSVQLTAAAATWNGNTASVVIWDGTAADSSHGTSTGYTVTVDASERYTAGQNSITLIKSSWNAGVVAFRKSNTTSGTRTVQLTAAAATWDGNTASVAIWDGTAADSSHGVDTGYTVTVDASARYTAGETAGQNAVTITKGSWNAGQISFTKSVGTDSTKSVQLTAAAATWNGNTASVVIWDGTAADSSHGTSTGYTVTVDASERYTAGQNSITLIKSSWNAGVVAFRKSNTTSGTRTVQLTAAAATWDGNTASVAIWDGTAADSSHGVNTGYTVTVDASARYTAGETAGITAGQNAVTITKGSWNAGQISFTKSAGTASTKSVQLTAAAATWSDNTASVVIWDGTAADSSHGVSTGYTVTVDASARYNAGVTAGTTAGQNAVTITKGSWSGGQISFTKSAGTASTKSVQLTAAAATWNENTASVVIWDGTAADSSHGVSTGYTVTVDASARYTAGETAGQNAVTITKGSWSGGQISFTKSAGTASTKSVQLTAAAATWSDNTASVVIWDGTAADSSHGVSTGYTVTVDASARYNAGVTAGTTAGQNAVTITKGSWSGGKISFTKSAGTASTKSVQLTAAAATWSGNTASVVIWDGTAADSSHGVSTGYTVTVDASARYNAGVTAGTTAGQNAVTINKGSWSGGKISFTKSAGTASTKSVQLTAAAATWNGNTASVVIWDGTAANTSSGVSTGYTVTVNAAARYTAGYDDGWKAAGAASNPPSTTGTLTNHANFTWPQSSVSGGVNSRDYYVTIDSPTSSGSGSSIKYTVKAFIRQNGASGSKVAQASLDITSVYNAGVSAGAASSTYTSRSNGAWGLTYFSATADHTVASKLYYLENGSYKSAGTYFWYHRGSYLQTQTVYTK